MKIWSENNELFIKELEEGFAWQALPMLFFKLNGFEVQMPELEIREDSIKNADRFFNSKDLFVNGMRIEIKSRKEKFTSPESFPYETAMVDTVKKFTGRKDKPVAYVMISRHTGSMLWVDATRHEDWEIIERFDNTRKFREKFFVVSKNKLMTLNTLVTAIKRASGV
jgi:hypothetical protein